MKRHFSIFAVIFTLLTIVPFAASAQSSFLSYGVWAGVNVTRLQSKEISVNNVKNSMTGYQVGAMAQLDLPFVDLIPELWYVHGKSSIGNNSVTNHTIEVPVLVSMTFLDYIRVKVGPSFSLYNQGMIHFANGNKLNIGRVEPTVGYVIGGGLDIYRFMVDVRYNGQFKSQESILGVEIDNSAFDLRTHTFSLNIGYRF